MGLLISLANCNNILLLDLRKNKLIGKLSHYLKFLSHLNVINFGYNSFHGDIPEWIINFTTLYVLDLSNNKFSGRMPSHLERLQGFVNTSDSISVYEEMTIDMKESEYTISYLSSTNTIFDLSNNNLIGQIPTSIWTLSSLRLLNLSGNHLEGPIPASFSNISTLEQLDLSKNNLSGKIPNELSKLYSLVVLNVSSNNLCGPILGGTQFSTFNAAKFQRNKCLYGCPLDSCSGKENLVRECGNCSGISHIIKVGWLERLDEKMSLMALGIGFGIGIWGVVGVFIFSKGAKQWVLGLPPNQPTTTLLWNVSILYDSLHRDPDNECWLYYMVN